MPDIPPIGGSEAAAACGLDPYRSQVALWAEKRGLLPHFPGNEATEWGNRLQPVVADACEERGYPILPAPADGYTRDDAPFMVGHLDGFVGGDRPLGVAEIKTTSYWRGAEWDDDGAPIPYVLQCQHYLYLTGLKWALLAVLIGGQRLETRRIERDEKTIELLVARERDFYAACQREEPPPPDGGSATEQVLRSLYPHANAGEVIVFTSEDYETVQRLRELKEAGKAHKQAEAELEQRLKLRLGAAELGTYEGRIVCRWQTVVQHRKATAAKELSMRRFTLG